MPPPPITEIALLHTKSNTAPSPSAIILLQQAKQAQAKFSSYPVSLFSQVEDPSFIYLVGGWNSLQQHYEEWIPSATNREFMRRLVEEEGLEVVWLFHVETDAEGGSDGLELVLKAPVVALGRYGINAAEKEGFVRLLGEMKRYLVEDTKPFPVLQGRRVDKEEGREEVVLFSGWKEVQQHFSFEEMKEFQKLKGNLDLVEVKHLVRWEDKLDV